MLFSSMSKLLFLKTFFKIQTAAFDMLLQVVSVLKCNQSGLTSQVVDLVTVTSQQQCLIRIMDNTNIFFFQHSNVTCNIHMISA